MSELKAFQDEVGDWGDDTFNSKRNFHFASCVIGMENHLAKELEELKQTMNPEEETADMFIILLHYAHLHNFDLLEEARKKMEINRSRLWGEPDLDGVIEHLK